jgi:hypothetical protein
MLRATSIAAIVLAFPFATGVEHPDGEIALVRRLVAS